MSVIDRLAGAPISWGVCEVPGWGEELPAARVLSEMEQLGLAGTEVGSDGFLPAVPSNVRTIVADFGMTVIGGFVPLVLHLAGERLASIEVAHKAAARLSGAGGTTFITAPVMTWDWGKRAELKHEQWSHLYEMLAEIEELVAEYGMRQAIHPHIGTVIESKSDVDRVLRNTAVGWTFDTGHLLVGGTDPVEFIDKAGERIVHVHLKDVHLNLAERVLSEEMTLMEGVQAGMFCILGRGDVAIADIVNRLEDLGYDRWYVLEQDAALTEGVPPVGSGPFLDVQLSIEYLKGVDASRTSSLSDGTR